MTTTVLAQVSIADLTQFLEVFCTEGLDKRSEHGCSGATVYTPVDDHHQVLVMLEFPDVQSFDGFRNDDSAPPIMRKGGAQGPPTFTVLGRVAAYQH